MRRKHRRSKKTVFHKTRNLRYRSTTGKLEWLLKLYSQELCSTIDRYKNGENAYIYSKQQQQNRDVALKLCVYMASDNLHLQSRNARSTYGRRNQTPDSSIRESTCL
jgi:hypothetical protein